MNLVKRLRDLVLSTLFVSSLPTLRGDPRGVVIPGHEIVRVLREQRPAPRGR